MYKTYLFSRLGLFLLALFLTSLNVLAQRTITGTITDNNGDGLPGASVTLKGTTNGTITDFDGKYRLEVPEEGGILVYSFIGFLTQEKEITGANVMNLVMGEDTEVLEEVVVIGYGAVKKDDLTGSVGVVDTEDFNQGQNASPEQLITGKLPGIQVTPGGGIPGGASTIRIRGGASLSANNDPLIIIDGLPMEKAVAGSGNILNTINPNDIESFTVLKDASATAIYGSRASNGVIIITTKDGGKKLKVNLTTNFGVAQIPQLIEPLNATEFRTLVEEIGTNNQNNLLGDSNTNWQEAIFQTAYGNDNSLSVSGRVGKVLPFRVSGGYTNLNGILKTSNMERMTGSLRLSPTLLNDNLKVNVNAKVSQVNNRFADPGAIATAIQMDPTQPIYNSDSDAYGGYFEWLDNNGRPVVLAPRNPLAMLELKEDLSTVNRFIGNVQLDYKLPFFPRLSANLNIGTDRQEGNGTVFVDTTAALSFYNGTGGTDNEYSETRTNDLLDFYLKYDQPIGENNSLDFTAGYSYQDFFVENQFINRDVKNIETDTTDFKGDYVLVSFFGRLNYNIADKYLLTATLRQDGTSRFSKENRWGLFPAAAFAWNIARENFLKESNTLTTLKLRVGYGVTGQQDVGGFYDYLARYTYSNPRGLYQFGDEFVTMLRPDPYDANLKWEETTTYNFGLDYGFVRDRISGSLDFYFRKTDDLLSLSSVPVGTNFNNQINTNIGSLNNQGLEFAINSVNIDNGNITWETGFNLTYAETKITNLTLYDDPTYLGNTVGGISGGTGNTVQIHSTGFAPNSFFLLEQVYDAEGNPIQGEYVNLYDADTIITELDQRHIYNPMPNLTMGFNTNFKLGGFDLAIVTRASFGNYIYNNLRSNWGIQNIGGFSQFHNNVLPEANVSNFDEYQYLSDYYLEDASFFKIDNITLGYTFDKFFTDKLSARISGSVQNALIVSNYSGLDPEIFGGIDNNFYPRPRLYIIGLNLNFK